MATSKPKRIGDAERRKKFFSGLSSLLGQEIEDVREVFSGIRTQDMPLAANWFSCLCKRPLENQLSSRPLVPIPEDPAYTALKKVWLNAPPRDPLIFIEALTQKSNHPSGYFTLRQVSSKKAKDVRTLYKEGRRWLLFAIYRNAQTKDNLRMIVLVDLAKALELPALHHRINKADNTPYLEFDVTEVPPGVAFPNWVAQE